MKKDLLIVAVVAFALSFVACSGKKAENVQVEEVTTEQVVVDSDEADVLTRYEAIIEKAIELQEKVVKGDAEATQEYAKLEEEMASIAAELQTEMANLTPEQTQKLMELAQKWAAANESKATPQ